MIKRKKKKKKLSKKAKKIEKKKREKKRKLKKKQKKKLKKIGKDKKPRDGVDNIDEEDDDDDVVGSGGGGGDENKSIDNKKDKLMKDISIEMNEKAKSMAPMTKEEWDKRQSVVRKVYDEETGRHRLIKGDGEIIEEIVSRDRHKDINRQATRGDGDYFQSRMRANK